MNVKGLVIRKETKNNEFRTPLVPDDVAALLQNGFEIIVESSDGRCFKDDEYKKVGAKIVGSNSWKNFKYPNYLILGLKDLNNYEFLDNHAHAYFSHFIKTKDPTLNFFKNSNSIIYDLEYLRNEKNVRLTSFGFYAGYTGALLGILHHTNELNFPLLPWTIEPKWINKQKLRVAIIGPNGRCGNGAINLCKQYKSFIDIEEFPRNKPKINLYNYDIILNCIYLHEYIKPFISCDDISKFQKKCTIVDISCEPQHIYNPLPIYNKVCSWDKYYTDISENLTIISLNNLPSLYPKNSSVFFSRNLLNLLIHGKDVWNRCYQYYLNAIAI